MLIVEGPDGGGKTTLIKQLHESLGWPIAGRVVSKDTYAMVDLVEWTENNLSEGFQPTIFDRHRLISDPIYRFILPSKKMAPDIYHLPQLKRWYQRFYRISPMVVYCLPPLNVVIENLMDDIDNRIVRPHVHRIYYAYMVQAARDLGSNPGWVWIYDYTSDSAEELLTRIKETIDYRTAETRRY